MFQFIFHDIFTLHLTSFVKTDVMTLPLDRGNDLSTLNADENQPY